jgi:hypothetical protein
MRRLLLQPTNVSAVVCTYLAALLKSNAVCDVNWILDMILSGPNSITCRVYVYVTQAIHQNNVIAYKPDHMLHDCAVYSNVVSTVRSVNGDRPKWTRYRSETPSPMKTKLNTFDYIWRNFSRAKTHHKPVRGACPTTGQRIRQPKWSPIN